ncbi:MAG: MATE family efflux transporter, partial [Myxococcales bacterium]|nr:MATE family efflux transporter [Myxococcales bacterium]
MTRPSEPALPAPSSSEPTLASATTLRERARTILALALPIIGGMASQNVLNIVDTAMVGQLGSPALGAVGFGGVVHWLAASFFLGMGSGVQAIAARRTGEKDTRGAVASVHGALIVVALLVIPYALLLSTQTDWIYNLLSDDKRVIELGAPYLRVRLYAMCFVVCNYSFRGYWNGIGRSTVYLRTILVIHVVNIFLNWVLIFGNLGFPKLGVTGAGIASAIAVACGTLTYCVLAYRHSRDDGFLTRGATPPGTVRNVLRLSVPAGMQNLFMSAGFVALYRIAQLLGT